MERIIREIENNITVDEIMELTSGVLDLCITIQAVDDEHAKKLDNACNTILEYLNGTY